MKLDKSVLSLYAVTDRRWCGEKTFEQQIEESIEGGITILQLREKNITYQKFKDEGIKVKKICSAYYIPFIIDDDVYLAKEIDADGVHIGQSDMKLIDARKVLGNEKIIGVSVQTVEQAVSAEKYGADYLGVGAVFSTNTKDDADSVSLETLKAICASVSIPVVAIGGITFENIASLSGSGISGIAAISAIYAQKDIRLSCKLLHNKVRECFYGTDAS